MAGSADGFCDVLGDYLIAEFSKHWKKQVSLSVFKQIDCRCLNSIPKHGGPMKISLLESVCLTFMSSCYALCFGEHVSLQ